jgi:hypothetical protein
VRVLIVVGLVVLLAGCGGGSDGGRTAVPAPTSTSAVSGATLDGEAISLDDFRGRPVLVNVWSSW